MANDIYKRLMHNKIITEDELYGDDQPPTDFLSSGIVSLNCACSGKIDGAIAVGKITLFSAHSMLGKTIIGMLALRDAQRKGYYCVVLDAEYQWDWKLAAKIGIDPNPEKIIVIPNNQLEEVQEKVMKIVGHVSIDERKNIVFMLDSWGSLVTYEGVKKAGESDSKKDMQAVQKKNNFANMILTTRATWYITNGVYDNVGGFGELLKIPGGKRIILNAHTVILGKSKAKDETKSKNESEITGAIVSCKMHKARFAREHKEFQFRINYTGGLDIFYGILDDAIAGGYVKEDGNSYIRPCVKGDVKWKEKNIYCSKFWTPVFQETDFKEYLEKQYTFQGDFDIQTNDFYEKVADSSQNENATIIDESTEK